jgi:hypothetical protein
MSDKIANDEPAFPFTIEEGLVCEGMSLRDYFAIRIMQNLSSEYGYLVDMEVWRNSIECAYAVADEMLRVREKQ